MINAIKTLTYNWNLFVNPGLANARSDPFEANGRSIDLDPAPDTLYRKGPTVKIQQSEIAFSSNGSDRLLSSAGAGPCIIFAARNRGTRNGFMTHISSAAEIAPETRSGSGVLEKFKAQMEHDRATTAGDNTVDIYMIGGYSLLSDLMNGSINSFIGELSKYVLIGEIHQKINENWCSNVVLDFDSGNIYTYKCTRDINQRPLDYVQGALTSFTHLLNPWCELIDVTPQN
jgi:hypothetical protein